MATVVGLFDNTAQAQAAVEQLRASGINANDISVAMRSAETTETTEVVTDTGGAGGAVTGAVGGGLLGGLAGLLSRSWRDSNPWYRPAGRRRTPRYGAGRRWYRRCCRWAGWRPRRRRRARRGSPPVRNRRCARRRIANSPRARRPGRYGA